MNKGMAMRSMQRLLLLIGVLIISSMPAYAMNWLRQYDILVRPELHWNTNWMLTNWTETGFKPATAFNACDEQVNAAQFLNSNQDGLAMLNGFNPSTAIGQLRLQVDANDDGVRGHFNVCADLRELFTTIFGAYYKFHDNFWVAGYLPVMGQRLTNVNWNNQTLSLTASDARVQNYLTNDFFTNVCDLGSLQLGSWKRIGVGDAVVMVEFLKNYPQRRDILHNVMLNWCCGFNIPTGLPRDEDKILAFPFGYDGSWGVIFGGGLRVNLADIIQLGADIRLTHLIGNTRCRRIKTSPDQTEFLLLAKAPAFKDFGMIQLFSLYMQTYHIARGLTLLAGYQFLKKGLDTLQLETCEFSNIIANTALSLREWMVHQVVLNATYDFHYDFPDASVSPQASIFMRLPFDGRRSVAFSTIGFMFALEF
jgi:hypothetical protein